jgi:hypothetical protein
VTPLEAAKALAATDNLRHDTIDDVPHCNFCGQDYEHASDCPWLAMPQIVAALEAAQALVDYGFVATYSGGPYGEYNVNICGACEDRGDHADDHQNDCRGQALKRALKGESA